MNHSHGWFCSNRSDDALELIRANKNAFVLLYIIASRARWKEGGFNQHGLKFGEAFLGDYANCGMTEREYRTAKKLLEKGCFVTFKPTSKGTVAKLVSMGIFDISFHSATDKATGQRRTDNGQESDKRRAGDD